ncbi:MAG: response regulator, partial [Myxococcales bacterium]|nr:response regulator [Myxococcales bacterium]
MSDDDESQARGATDPEAAAAPAGSEGDDDLFAGTLIDDAEAAAPTVATSDPAASAAPDPEETVEAAAARPPDPADDRERSKYRHDLRTPFNMIIGYSEMLLEDAEDQEDDFLLGKLEQLLGDGRSLLALLNKLVSPASAGANQALVSREFLPSLARLVNQVERLRGECSRAERDDVLADVDRILKSVRDLDELVAAGYLDRAMGVGEAPAAAPEPSPAPTADAAAPDASDDADSDADDAAADDDDPFADTFVEDGDAGDGSGEGDAYLDLDLGDEPESAPQAPIEVPEEDDEDKPNSSIQRSTAAQYRHDLRTPFNLIIGYSEMLIEDAEVEGDEFLLSHLHRILGDSQSLLALVDEILDPSSRGPSQERLNRDLLFPLSHLLSHVERLREQCEQGERDDVLPDIDRILKAVRRLDQLVATGTINKAAGAARTDPEYAAARTGTGAAAARSGPGAVKTPQLKKRSVVREKAETGKILVVDDNESNRNMLSRRLERQGHTTRLAENGIKALEKLRKEDFDLVLLDVMMPEMDGYEVLERLHNDDKLRGLPVIMISALDQLDTVVRCIELGAEDYLPKPFNPVVLRARIGACLEKKRLRDRERAYIKKLRIEQERSDQLLLNILPRPIANRLKEGQRQIADYFPDVTVLFCDLVGFTQISERLPPAELVAMLNKIFSMFDLLAEKHGLEKIKTIGDEYMIAGGLPMPRKDHAEAVAEMALDMLAVMDRFNAKHNTNVRIRVGLNCGPVTAGVIGTKKFAYDLWGDTVNLASRMESHGIANAIQVTEETYRRLRHRYAFQR